MLRKIRKNYKRLTAFLLSAAMIITNAGGNAGTVFAAEWQEERESAIFMADGQEILEAIRELDGQEALNKEDLEEMGLEADRKGVVKKYEKLLLPEKGKVYQLALNIDRELAAEGTALQVFYNTETEEVIFLYLNESGRAVDCYVNIDGYETKLVTVEANSVNVVSEADVPGTEEEGGEEEPGNGGETSSGGAGGSGGSSGGGSGSAGGSPDSGSGGGAGGAESPSADGAEEKDDSEGEAGEETAESGREESSPEARPGEEGAGNAPDKASEGEGTDGVKEDGEKAEPDKKETEDAGSEDAGTRETSSGKDDSGKDRPAREDKPDKADSETGAGDEGKTEEDSAKREDEGQGGRSEEDTADKENPGDGKDKAPGKPDSQKPETPDKPDSGKEDAPAQSGGQDGGNVKEDAGQKPDKDGAKEEAADKPDGGGTKEEAADKPDGSGAKEEASDKPDGSGAKEEAADKPDGGGTKEEASDKPDGSGAKEKTEGRSDGRPSREDSGSRASDRNEGKASDAGSGSSDRDGNDAGDRRDGNSLTLSMSRHQAAAVAVRLDEHQSEREAGEETETETSEKTTAEKENEEETETEAREDATAEEETKGETGAEPAVEEETAEKTEAETVEKAEEARETTKAAEDEGTEKGSEAKETEIAETEGKETEATETEGRETETEGTVKETEEAGKETEQPSGTEEAGQPSRAEEAGKETGQPSGAEEAGEGAAPEGAEESSEKAEEPSGTAAAGTPEETTSAEAGSGAEGGGQGGADQGGGKENAGELSDDWEIPGKAYDTIAIRGTINARAYVVSLADIRKIVELNQELETETESVALARTYTAETDDACFTVNVPEGAFQEEVALKVVKIENEQQLDRLAEQADGALGDDKAVAGVLAYDITFISAENGSEVEPLKAVSVGISLKEVANPEKKAAPKAQEDGVEGQEISEVSVMHLPENESAEVMSTTGDAQATDFEFQAESFSVYVVAYVTLTYTTGMAVEAEGNRYETLQAAIDAIDDSKGEATITLWENIEEENITSVGKSFTLNLNDNKVTGKNNIFNFSGGSITIKKGTIMGKSVSSGGKDGKIKADNTELTLDSCLVLGENSDKSSKNGSGIYMKGGSLSIKDCQFCDNNVYNNSNGGSIHADGCSVSITGMFKITNGANGFGVWIKDADLTINVNKGSEICDNNLSVNGKGIYAKNSAVNISNISLLGCRVEIANTTSKEILFNGVELNGTKNSIGSFGFSVDNPGNVKFTDCIFKDNKTLAYSPGAILFLKGTGNKTLNGCQFINNTGRGYYANLAPVGVIKGDIELTGCTFRGNTKFKAGAICNTSSGKMSINKTTIEGNSGGASGGIYVSGTTVNVSNTVIKNNIGESEYYMGVYQNSGGISLDGTAVFKMASGAIYGNVSKKASDGSDDVYVSTNANVNILPVNLMEDVDAESGYFSRYGWSMNGDKADSKRILKSKGSWKVAEADNPVAEITGKAEYKSLAEALEAAVDGDTIKLIADQVPISQVLIVDKKITVDLNGKTITVSGKAGGTVAWDGGTFKVAENGTLTLIGDGTLNNRIIMGGGTLNLKGNVNIIPTPNSVYPDTGVIGSYNKSDAIQGGIINVSADMDKLSVYMNEGELIFNDGFRIGDFYINAAASQDKTLGVKINGSAGKLTINQNGVLEKGSCVLELNGEVDALDLTHNVPSALHSSTENYYPPVTKAGEGFRAKEILLRPFAGAAQNTINDQIDPKLKVDDILVIKGPIQADWIDLKNADWAAYNSLTLDGGDYKFLTKVVLDEKGNLVLRKSLPEGVFLSSSGVEGNNGVEPDKPVRTFKEAEKILEDTNQENIYIVGKVTVTSKEEWTPEKPRTIRRYGTYLGQMVEVANGGHLTLKNIIIDGDINTSDKNLAVRTAIIKNKGTLIIQDGTILQNNRNVFDKTENLGNNDACEGGAVWNSGTLEMTGGKITGNSAVSGAGVFTEGEFNFSGGDIIGNTGSGTMRIVSDDTYTSPNAGGGVFIACDTGVMNMSGGKVTGNTAQAGGGISLGNNISEYCGGCLIMNGGDVSGNTALNTETYRNSFAGGGGIYVQSGCKAEIHGGRITGNTSYGGMFGGGGIYVNDDEKKPKSNGVLNLYNVKITGNTAYGDGGGIAACDTSNVSILLTDGGIIHGNTGKGKPYDIYYSPFIPDGRPFGKVKISDYMLGNALYDWKIVEGIGEPGEICIYSGAKETSGEKSVKVTISGNRSATKGGGIGTNGDVIIGKEGNTDTIKITVTKQWKWEKGGEVLTREELNQPGGINETFFFEDIKFTLWQKNGSGQWKEIKSKNSSPNKTGNTGEWSVAEFIDLRKNDEFGNPVEYKVTEEKSDRFINISDETVVDVDSNGNQAWTFTNMPVYSLKLVKEVVNERQYEGYEDDSFDFTIVLTHKDETPFTEEEIKALKVEYSGSDEETVIPDEAITEADGVRSIAASLKADEFIWLKGLPMGTRYSIREEQKEDYETSWEITAHKADGIGFTSEKKEKSNQTGDKTVKLGENKVVFTNSVKITGSLKFQKKVVDGDLGKPWTFTVELKDKDGGMLETGREFYSFTWYKDGVIQGSTEKKIIFGGKVSATLTHNQALEIGNLPVGTVYEIIEVPRDEDYTVSISGEGVSSIRENSQDPESSIIGATGVIGKGEVSDVTVTNSLNTGSLAVSKKVLAPGGNLTERNKSDEFTFTVELAKTPGSNGDLRNIRYTFGRLDGFDGILQPDDRALERITEEKDRLNVKLTLKHGQEIIISGLPEGSTYSVTEENAGAGGYVSADSQFDGTIETDGEHKAAFVNVVSTSGLIITKTVAGSSLTEEDFAAEFMFEVEFTDRDGSILTGRYPYTGAKEGTVASGETISLKSGEMVLIQDLPEGAGYTVWERAENTAGYEAGVSGSQKVEGKTGTVLGGTGVVEDGKGAAVHFTNTVKISSLSVEKMVTGEAGDRDLRFAFDITLTKNGKPLSGTYPYSGEAVEDGAQSPGTGRITLDGQGTGRVFLAHGQKITVSGLPVGASYQVTEVRANQDGYATTATGGTGVIKEKEDQEARFVNHKPEKPTEPTKPTEPENPAEPSSPTDPSEPAEPEGPTEPEPANPDETIPQESPEEPENPDETTPAESPENPTAPSRPSGGGGGGRDRDRNPEVTPETAPIPPEEVPLANIDPDDVPLAMMPSESPTEAMVIDDEGVPLFGLPRTGDRGVQPGALLGMMLLSLMAACGIHVKKRKEEE